MRLAWRVEVVDGTHAPQNDAGAVTEGCRPENQVVAAAMPPTSIDRATG